MIRRRAASYDRRGSDAGFFLMEFPLAHVISSVKDRNSTAPRWAPFLFLRAFKKKTILKKFEYHNEVIL